MSLREQLGLPLPKQMTDEQRRLYTNALAANTRKNNPEAAKARACRYHAKYPDRKKFFTQRWRDQNRDHLLTYDKAKHERDYADPVKREQIKQRVLAYTQRRKKQEPAFRAMITQRSRLSGLLRGANWSKNSKTLGFSTEELREAMERKFLPGMTWENYGRGKHKWHIDHIIPCTRFDLTEPTQVRKCFSLANLQPLWGSDNIRKSNKTLTQQELPFSTIGLYGARMPGQVMQ